jgi:hypothetical protein
VLNEAKVIEVFIEPLHAADNVVGLEHQDEGHGVAKENAEQQNVAELSARRPHHGRVVVSEENTGHQGGHSDARGGERHGANRPSAVRSQVHLGDGLALGVPGVGQRALRTQLALRLVICVPNLRKHIQYLVTFYHTLAANRRKRILLAERSLDLSFLQIKDEKYPP